MTDDYLVLLREFDAKAQRERERKAAEKAAIEAETNEWFDTWNAVFDALHADGDDPESTPNLSPLVELARLLKRRGYDYWLPEMAANFAPILDDFRAFRPAQLYFVQLLITAGRPRATLKQIAAQYRAYVPSNPPTKYWRETGARDVFDFALQRIEKAEKDKAQRAQEEAQRAAVDRKAKLLKSAKRRSAIEKQVYAVYWSDRGLRPAKIRDMWNAKHPSERLEPGRPGRHDIRIAVERGRAFIADHETSTTELATVLGISLTA